MGVKGYAIHLSFSPGNSVLNAYKPPKSTRTQGGDPIADYIMADTKLPAYLPYPRFLLKMEISQTAKLLYALLLDRSTLSQKNKWQDGEGRIYIIYPIAEIAEILDKGSTTIKGALNELDMAGLLERFIEEMSRYLAASGKSYQNYAAALRIWAGNDKKGAPKKGIPDYSCKEGESL